MEPRGHGSSVHDQPPQSIVQAAHCEDVCDRFEGIQPSCERRHAPQYCGEHRGSLRRPKAVIHGQRSHRHLHLAVVGAPDSGVEFIQARHDPRRRRSGRRGSGSKAVVAAEVGNAAFGPLHMRRPRSDLLQPGVDGRSVSGRIYHNVGCNHPFCSAHAGHVRRIARPRKQPHHPGTASPRHPGLRGDHLAKDPVDRGPP